jgi:hypothetical protein
MTKWAAKAKEAKEQVGKTEMDADKLSAFIRSAGADKDLIPLEEEPVVETVIKNKRLPQKETVKVKKPLGRPKKVGEVVRKQFDIPVDIVDKLVRLAEDRYGDNQTKALIAVLTGKDKL